MDPNLTAYSNGLNFFTPRATSFFTEESYLLECNKIQYPEPSYQEHFTRSQDAIIQAIEGLKNTALILGAGGLNDIPLIKLAEQFDYVILVDVNLKYTEIALKRIPEGLQKKCSLMQEDLTGFFSEFSVLVEKIAQEQLPYEDFISKILDALPTLKRKEFDLRDIRPSFICSSLLCSQLCGGVIKFLEQVSQSFYEQSFVMPAEREGAFDHWMTQIQISHIDELHRLVDEKGKVYFADHFSAKGVCFLKSVIEERRIILGKSFFQGALKVKAHLEERFSSLDKKNWTWSLFVKKSVGKGSLEQEDGSQLTVSVDVTETKECQITSLTLSPK